MEYQKIMHVLDNTRNQPSKFRTRRWVEINDESRGKYDNMIIVALNLKLQWKGQIYGIIVMHIFLLVEL